MQPLVHSELDSFPSARGSVLRAGAVRQPEPDDDHGVQHGHAAGQLAHADLRLRIPTRSHGRARETGSCVSEFYRLLTCTL